MQIFVQKGGQQLGPYTPDQVTEYLAQGSLQATDPAWHDGLADWCPLNQIAGVVDASSSAPPAFDPETFNPNAAPPPAAVQSDVLSATPDAVRINLPAGDATCPQCQAPTKPEMLFCGACGHDLQAGWQDKMTSYPTDAPQAEGSADSGQLAVSANGPEKLPAPISSRIIAGIFAPIGLALMVPGCWVLSGPILGFRTLFGVDVPRDDELSHQQSTVIFGLFLLALLLLVNLSWPL